MTKETYIAIGHILESTAFRSRFWSHVPSRPVDRCWLWAGAKNPKGYGSVRVGGRGGVSISAPRVSFLISKGPIPPGLHVLHNCDVPSCVNPAHLRLGTNADNVKDRDSRGRFVVLRGEKNGNSRISDEDIARIREEFREDPSRGKQTRLAEKYGVDHTLVYLIVRKGYRSGSG